MSKRANGSTLDYNTACSTVDPSKMMKRLTKNIISCPSKDFSRVFLNEGEEQLPSGKQDRTKGQWIVSTYKSDESGPDCTNIKFIDLIKGLWIIYNMNDPSEKEIDRFDWRIFDDSTV